MNSIFAIVMYTLWWHKPLAPEEPIVLKGDWVNPLCAYMYMSSEISGFSKPGPVDQFEMATKFFASFDWQIFCNLSEMEYMVYCGSGGDASTEDGPHLSRTRFRPAAKGSLPLTVFRKPEEALEFNNLSQSTRNATSLDAKDQIRINRWNLATKAVEEYPAIRRDYERGSQMNGYSHFRSEELLKRKAGNGDPKGLLLSLDRATLQTVIWLPSLLYGALHLVAWKEHFPSTAEKWLWRSATVYICCCAGMWLTVCYGLHYGARAWRPIRVFYKKLNKIWWVNLLTDIIGHVLSQSLLLGVWLFLLAKHFIVVEALISIRNLPAKVYDTPSWIQILPHL